MGRRLHLDIDLDAFATTSYDSDRIHIDTGGMASATASAVREIAHLFERGATAGEAWNRNGGDPTLIGTWNVTVEGD